MLKYMSQVTKYCKQYNIQLSELVSLLINKEGVNTNFSANRVRFNLNNLGNLNLMFSVQNTSESIFSFIKNNLVINNIILGTISNLVEDSCEVFYTRKEGKVLCFNPNSRSSCHGCKFCYSPTSSDDDKIILTSEIYNSFINWIEKEKVENLSHLEQIAVVTGCFKNDKQIIDYLSKVRETATRLSFSGELLFFGMPLEESTFYHLEKIKPINLCFTIECFENRDILISNDKRAKIVDVKHKMNIAKSLGIKTNFSYIVGLDSINVIEENFKSLKNSINCFPIISVYQTDTNRIKYRNKDASSIDYYLKIRQIIEDIMEDTKFRPKTWNNYRSLWREYFKDETLQD